MEFVTLRRAGGSLTLTIPKGFARTLGLEAGERLGVSIAGGKLVAEPIHDEPTIYTLEVLAQCDPDAPLTAEDEAWLSDGPKGSELIR